jgi:GH24 family phage-related lysozyme (muramidase)
MTKNFDKGLGKATRDVQTGGNRLPIYSEQPALGFFIGTVMDDQDDQRMGRIWVYVPEYSSKRFDENSVPMYGGTTLDRQTGDLEYDMELRNGWIMCYPLLPAFGSDDYRVGQAVDGRASREGDVNTYGLWHQPRIGDYVGVMFEKGDPASGFWIGCMPKYYRNYMVPGHPAKSKDGIDDEVNSAARDESGADALIPAMDHARDRDGDQNPPSRPSTIFADNLLVSGTLADIHRGAGTSSSRRESPSYVSGWKSAGWNLDSEKYNKNVDGASQFQEEAAKYAKVNANGHQFIMDDHPDHQGVRIRTSYGSQVYMHDAGPTPYIYVTTPKGNLWLELVDDGNIHVYGRGRFSLHAETDINLTADRDLNIEVGRNMNILVHNDERMTVKNQTHWAFEKDHRILNMTNLDHIIQRNHSVLVEKDFDRIISGGMKSKVGQSQSFVIGEDLITKSGGNTYFQADGILSEEAALIFMNSGITQEPEQADKAEKTNFPKLTKKPGPPTEQEIKQNGRPKDREYLGAIVPQHQPWPLRCGVGNTLGTNNGVSPRAPTGTVPPAQQDTRCFQVNPEQNFRLGAPIVDQAEPTPVVGKLPGDVANNIYVGTPYETTNRGEAPNYKMGRSLRPGEEAFVGDLNTSNRMKDFIKQQEVFQTTPTLDVRGNPIIGYGHVMKVGDTLGGVTITQQILDQIKSLSKAPNDLIVISESEASDLLNAELEQTEQEIANLFDQDYLMPQGTFDGLVSLGRNVGVGGLKNTPEGRNIVNGIKQGNAQQVQSNWMKFVQTDGVVRCDLVNRRQDEINRGLGQNPDQDGITDQAKEYQPGDPVGCANTQIDRGVLNAISQSSQNNGVPYEYLMAVASQESRFNPNARAGTSRAKGLFQFIDSTWDQYGNGGNVFDPNANADAAGRLAKDNKAILEGGALNGVRPANRTDLYMAHFLGGGGANQFLSNLQSNPNGSAAAAFPAAAAANPSIFFNKDGSPKTNQQVYNYFDKSLNNKIQTYGGCTV